MKVLVIGAGIGGLCAGLVLRRLGHEVQVFEKVREIRPVGAALSLWSNGVLCLNHVGVAAEVAALGGRMDGMGYVDGLSGEEMCRFSLLPLYERVGQRAYPVARAELQRMLMDVFGHDAIALGREMTAVEDDGTRVTAHFADGTSASGDLLIGADGAHSRVRRHVLGRTLTRRPAGYVNWNGLVEADAEIAPLDHWTTFVAQGKRVSVMPVAGERFYFFFDTPLKAGEAPAREAWREILATEFEGWAAPVQTLISRLDPARTNRVEIQDIDPFMTWTRGRVALLGDSAHNTTPDIGQGACMAAEDAVALERAFQAPGVSVEEALKAYEAARAPRAGELVLRARKRCDVTHAADPEATAAWYEELRRETGAGVISGLEKTILGGPLTS